MRTRSATQSILPDAYTNHATSRPSTAMATAMATSRPSGSPAVPAVSCPTTGSRNVDEPPLRTRVQHPRPRCADGQQHERQAS